MSAIRHHYVPQGYLRGFTTDDDSSGNFVWVYDKTNGRPPKKRSVKSIAWEPEYYATEHPDGSIDLDSVENALAKSIDNEIPKILKSIIPIAGIPVKISEEDKETLAYFIALSMTRVPSFRDGINTLHKKIGQNVLTFMLEQDLELKNLASKYGLILEAKPWASLYPMFGMAKLIANSSLSKNWQFFVPPPEVPLITSDNPVVFSGAAAGLKQLGPAHPQSELLMHLRKDLALVCTPQTGYPDMQVFPLRPYDARNFNRSIVHAARQRVFASHYSDKFDSFVKKYAGLEQRVII